MPRNNKGEFVPWTKYQMTLDELIKSKGGSLAFHIVFDEEDLEFVNHPLDLLCQLISPDYYIDYHSEMGGDGFPVIIEPSHRDYVGSKSWMESDDICDQCGNRTSSASERS